MQTVRFREGLFDLAPEIGARLVSQGFSQMNRSFLAGHPGQCPDSVLAEHWVGIFQQGSQRGDSRRFVRIAQDYRGVSQKASPFCTLNGGAREALSEAVFVEREQFDRVDETWHQGHWRICGGLLVPGANLLADVATENVVADKGSEIPRYAPAVFYSQIGDAPAGIQHPGGYQSFRRAGVEATGTVAASIGDLRFARG